MAQRLLALLRRQSHVFHELGRPASALDSDWPSSLVAVYRAFDGATLFFEALVLFPSPQVKRLPPGAGQEGFLVGELEGDQLVVDTRDRVFRHESDTGEWLPEGSDFVRWLFGAVEAAALLYDKEGEFAEQAFEESGELSLDTSERMYRSVLARDRKASAPRWRLARVLAAKGDLTGAREQLERVVADSPDFAWAWYDLARISELLGELETALDEYAAAAECRERHEHQGFFFAHAARVAAALGDQTRRAEYADKALARDRDLARTQREGAAALLAEGDGEAALELCRLAAALTPRDLTVLDLMRRAHTLALEQADSYADEEDGGGDEEDGEDEDEAD